MKMYAKFLLAGLVVPVAGTIPILLYAIFGPANGNPIGLGLLAWMSWMLGLILLLVGVIGYVSRKR